MTYLSPEDLKASLPRYRSHKIVQAARILEVLSLPLRFRLDLDLGAWFQPKALASTVMPEPGWWLVLYEDGYISFSPAKAFEEGYALLGDGVSLTTVAHPVGPPAPPVPTRCSARYKITEGFFLHCDLIKGHPGAHRDRTEHGWGYNPDKPSADEPGAAAGASDGPAAAAARCQGRTFDRHGNEFPPMACDLPDGHPGLHEHAPPSDGPAAAAAPSICSSVFVDDTGYRWICTLIEGHAGEHRSGAHAPPVADLPVRGTEVYDDLIVHPGGRSERRCPMLDGGRRCRLVDTHDGPCRFGGAAWGEAIARPAAAAAAPQVPRTCGTVFRAVPGREESDMPCAYPADHEGPHGRAWPHT